MMEDKSKLDDWLEYALKDPFFKTFGFFVDAAGILQAVYIRKSNLFTSVKSFNEIGEETGFNNVHLQENNRLYGSEIYCYRKYRGLRIATHLATMMDYLIQDYDNYILKGVRQPYEAEVDKSTETPESNDVLSTRADAFYRSMGFETIYYKDVLSNPSKYPLVDLYFDFHLQEEIPECLIVKKVTKKDFPFKIIDGLLVHDNALGRLADIKNFVADKGKSLNFSPIN